MASTDRISCCLWCGHEVTYRPNVPASVKRAKHEMAKHELACEESPVVQQMAALRLVNQQLTEAFQVRNRRSDLLERYINPRRKADPNILLDDLGALARDTAQDDDVMAYLRRKTPTSCALCGDVTRPAVPMRILAPMLTHVVLICQKCGPLASGARPPKEIIDNINEVAEMGLLEGAFLWKDGKRVRMLWGDKLQVETIR